MYRSYEDPYVLEEMLKEMLRYREQVESQIGRPFELDAGEEQDLWLELACVDESIWELRERINFAWQDDEAEVEGLE